MTPLVTVTDVHKHFTRGSERIDVLKGVNLEIPAGDFLALMGPSGSGKTTLLNLIGGLDVPTGGSVEVAVQSDDAGSFLFVIAGTAGAGSDVVERRTVSVGGADGDRVEVLGALRAGDRVVVSPPRELISGARVVAQ